MGVFSWLTLDTHKSISNAKHNPNHPIFTVYMVNPDTNEVYKEDNYEGYGVFGGKDYYELLAELNGLEADRNNGVDLECYHSDEILKAPVLVEHLEGWEQYKGKIPEVCPYQGYFYPRNIEDEVYTLDILK